MKRKLFMLTLACLMLFCAAASAQDVDQLNRPGTYTVAAPQEDIIREATCGQDGLKMVFDMAGTVKEVTIPATGKHTWGDWQVTRKATCAEEGERVRACSVCGNRETEKIQKTGEHSWGEWKTTAEATCTLEGKQTRTCKECGKTQTQSVSPLDHKWSSWKVVNEPTCTENGKQQHSCERCGKLEYLTIKKKGHTPGEWTVTEEPTCKKGGKRETTCTDCGAVIKEKLGKTDHAYEEWETVKEATDFTKGKERAACKYCGKKKTREFYPDGTLARDLENDPEKVKELQGVLSGMSLYSGKLTGSFDKGTVSAVKKLQKSLKQKTDGIAWPGLLKMLGLYGGMGGPISDDVDGYKLQLAVKQVSPAQSYYAVGDQLVYEWTLTNASVKNTAKDLKMYFFGGLMPAKKTDTEIDAVSDLGKGESASGTYTYTVTKKDALAGKFTFGFIARGRLGNSKMESNKVCFVNASSAGMGGTGGWTPPAEYALTLTKTLKNTPKNGLYFVKGEEIRFTVRVINTSGKEVKNVLLTDKLLKNWKQNIGTMAAGEEKTFEVKYTPQAKDVAAGEVSNTATVSYTGGDGKLKLAQVSAKAPVGQDTDGLYIFKKDTGTPKNGLFYTPGEEVTFEITIYNPTKRNFTNLRVYDWLKSKNVAWKSETKLGAGKSVTYTFKAKATAMMAKLGKMTNVVRVTYKDPAKKDRTGLSNECTVPCGLEGQDGVVVTKTVISTPKNGAWYQEGEEIRFQIEVHNNTVKEIIDMDVRDSLAEMDGNGHRTLHKNEKLAAGEVFQTHFSYVVTEDDTEATEVTNLASARWAVEKDEYTETYSDPVIVPTAETFLQRKAKPVSLEGEACASTLTAVGDGVTQKDLTECAEHAETADKSGELVKSGDLAGAGKLWEEDVQELFGEWIEKADGEGKRIAENEQAAFNHQVEALEKSMSLVCTPEEVETILLEEQMNKVVGLCYELHSAPATRPDSLESAAGTIVKGNHGEECSHSVTYGESGEARYVDDQCGNHTLTNQLTRYLLDMAGDGEERTEAWLRVQGNWLLELNSMYDVWYLSADAAQRVLIAADRMSFDELINARQASLAEMYPDDPATAAEVLANMIMDRTEMVCRELHKAGILTD